MLSCRSLRYMCSSLTVKVWFNSSARLWQFIDCTSKSENQILEQTFPISGAALICAVLKLQWKTIQLCFLLVSLVVVFLILYKISWKVLYGFSVEKVSSFCIHSKDSWEFKVFGKKPLGNVTAVWRRKFVLS